MNPQIVDVGDAADPRLADYRDVRDPTWLRRRDVFLAESRIVLERLLREPRFRVRSLLATETALRALDPDLRARLPLVFRVEHATLERVAGARFHQGCVALVERPAEIELADLLGRESWVWLVLERVSDPDNVGGLFRNARAFGADAVLLGPGCAHPLYRKCVRTSMGATLEVPFAHAAKWPGDLEQLRARGFRLLALTPRRDAQDIEALPALGRVALLVGDEGCGLSEGVLASCDLRVRIPMSSGVDSLNVATAAAIALHRLAPRLPAD